MRYVVFNHNGERVRWANTAQEVANLAHPGEFSMDTLAGPSAYPYTVYFRDSMGMVGVPFLWRYAAIKAAEAAYEDVR